MQEPRSARAYDELLRSMREVETLAAAGRLLSWDQETMMPARAAAFRAEELALLSRLAHERATHPRIGELLGSCEADRQWDAEPEVAANLRELRRDYDRARKLPGELVAELSEVASLALETWKLSREHSDFERFLPWLERLIALNRRKAACYGAPAGGDLYDALLEDYEPGTSGAVLARIFEPLRGALRPLVDAVSSCGRHPDRSVLDVELPLERQRELHRLVLQRVGFDLDAGRLDVSAHPFSSGVGAGDTRITTRYRDPGFVDALYSTLHEAGHALYEQGLPKADRAGQPLAQPLGLGVHESQSRLWENHVGRSRSFWTWALPEAQRIFGTPLASFSVEGLHLAVNAVRPHLIRVESDEVTYHFHVMLRFDLERAMIRDELAPAELPAAWRARLAADLGLAVPDDRRGCLQDVHWAMGAFGYFPSYTLGTLYAAQLWEALAREVGDVEQRVSRGDFAAVLDWLRRSVHVHGRRYPAAELCRRVTGESLSHEAFLRHVKRKLSEVYGLPG